MENIIQEVKTIGSGLQTSRSRLQKLEISAQKSITSEVDDIRTALKQGNNRIEYVTSEVHCHLRQIKFVEDASTTVDLAPQMTWLHDSLQNIILDLEDAKSKANGAIQCVNGYTYNVMDVAQEVESNSIKLTDHNTRATGLAAKAQSDLETSESLLEHTQSQIKKKEAEIKQKTSDARSKEKQKTQFESQMAQKHEEMRVARQQRQSKKEDSLLGLGVGLLGIAAAPFTAGISLGLTVGGGAMAGYKASRMDDFQNEINSCQSSINSFNSSISQYNRDVARLEREKTALEVLVRQYKSEISERKSNHRNHKQQIAEANRVQGQIGTLKSHAASTKANVTEALPNLQNIKSSLEQCSILVKERSLDVTVSSTTTERWISRVPALGNRIQRPRDFKKQQQIITQVSEILDTIHREMPLLLPSQQTKFLDIKPWNTADVSICTANQPIPDLRLHT